MTPERARRELRHLYRLRARDTYRSRVAAALRAVAGFGIGLAAATKAMVIKSVFGKLAVATVVGLFAAFPLILGWTILCVSLASLLLILVSCLIGEAFPCLECVGPDCVHCGNRLPADDCDMRNKRRRRLVAMIAEREKVVHGTRFRGT